MVKKKKNRSVKDTSLHNGADSSESADENKSCIAAGKCFHANKAVDLSRVKKALKCGTLALQCPECVKDSVEEEGADPGVWLCMRCGHQGCGRSQRQHALQHYQVAHSDPHCLAVHTTRWNIWCYTCEEEMQAFYRKKIEECVKFLKQLDCPSPTCKANSKSKIVEEEEEESVTADGNSKPLADVTNTPNATRSPKKRSSLSSQSLPRIRGLRNLGNTCFFNATLQCLAQTPFLLELLQDMRHCGQAFQLPGGKGLITGHDEELPALDGELGKWGPLTEVLAQSLEELRQDEVAAVNPQRLLSKLITRCPQFGGGDQHDAHELLRHLLEEVKTEDLKRYWTVILGNFGLTRHDTSETVEEKMRSKVKAYGRQAGEQILLPESVFRGLLVSTLECQDCFHSYQRLETFYELSLPVSANKPQPPVLRRKSSAEDSFDLQGNSTNETPSKHQLKKERRQQRKGRKKGQKGPRVLEMVSGEPPIAEEAQNSAESEQSDADVEDNLDQEVALKGAAKDVVESGYSSEKAAEGSTVASPVSMVNGDSVLASPDSGIKDKELNGELELSLVSCHCSGDVTSANHDCLSLPLRAGCSHPEAEQQLSVSIPLLTTPPSALGSPVSNTGSPSPDSSDFNIDSTNHASPGSCELNEDPDRPFSRIAFCNDEDSINCNAELQTVPCSPEEPFNNLGQRMNGCSTLKESISSDNLVKEITGMSLERQSPSHWDTCSAHSLEDTKDSKPVDTPLLCNGTTETEEPSKDSTTTLAPRYHCEAKECSVESCLNQFTVLELMTGSNKVNCENCSQRLNQGKEGKMVATNSTKQYLVSNPPSVLVLHLKRFEVHENMFRKTPRHVSFPMLLDIAPVCITKCWELPTVRRGQTKILYSLYGVVQHFGSIHGGHYSAYVKVRAPVAREDLRWNFLPNHASKQQLEETSKGLSIPTSPLPGKWYHVSDSKVNEVNEDRVLHSQAYLLFYERIW